MAAPVTVLGVVLAGGHADGTRGWFVEPTLIEVTDPRSPYLVEEYFGPIMAAYVYDDADWPSVLELVDTTSEYGLTGAVFATDLAELALDVDIGGVRTVGDAAEYLSLAASILGEGWATPQTFRFGASGLLGDILSVLGGQSAPPPPASY